MEDFQGKGKIEATDKEPWRRRPSWLQVSFVPVVPGGTRARRNHPLATSL